MRNLIIKNGINIADRDTGHELYCPHGMIMAGSKACKGFCNIHCAAIRQLKREDGEMRVSCMINSLDGHIIGSIKD